MTWELTVENIGGIKSGTASIEPGVNTVQASNWKGKSSLIKSIETVMGTAAPLTEGEDRGRVELVTEDGTIVTELVRQDGEILRRGDRYLSDERDRVRADLFAFLDEDNAVRRAVRNGENLEEIFTYPLDFERIDERIADLDHERQQVETELERAQDAARKLPSVQERVTTLSRKLETLRAEHEEVASDESGDDPGSERDALGDARAERDRLRDRIDRLEATIANARERLEERREDFEELEVPEDPEIEAQLSETRDDLHEIERDVELLQSVYTANKRVLDEGRVDLLAEVEHGLMEDSIACWVCGGSVKRDDLEAQLEILAERIASRRKTANEHRQRVDDLENQRRELRQKRREKQDLRAEINELENTIADREASLEAARDRIDEVDERIDDLSDAVDETDERLTDLKSELKYTQAELNDEREELESLEARADRREQLEETRQSLTDEIEALRTRKETVKRETREAFDDAIQDLIVQFDPGFDGARLTSTFDLVVARDGREASLNALSEGEVELLGIMAALAGYEAFDVADRVPVILLDGVGSLASENLETLVRYLADRAAYLVTTSYPEQGTFEGHVVDPTEWSTTSDETGSEAVS